MKFTATCLLLLLSSYGTRFKMHSKTKMNRQLDNMEALSIDLDEYWPFESTLEKFDPYIIEIVLGEPLNQDQFKKDKKIIISASAALFFQKSNL